MGAASDVVDALRDGDTSDGNFWIAIAVIAGAVILLVFIVCFCYAWRRRRRQRALRRKLNGAVDPDGLWAGDSTAPLAESRRRVRPAPHTLWCCSSSGSAGHTSSRAQVAWRRHAHHATAARVQSGQAAAVGEMPPAKRGSKGVPLVMHSSGMRAGGGALGDARPDFPVERPATPPKARANSLFIPSAHESASPPIARYGPPLADTPPLGAPQNGAAGVSSDRARRRSDAASGACAGEHLSPRSRTAMLGAVRLPGPQRAGVHMLRSTDGRASPARARSPSPGDGGGGGGGALSQRERSPLPLPPEHGRGDAAPRSRTASATAARPATPPRRDFTDRIQPPLPVSPRVFKQASLPMQRSAAASAAAPDAPPLAKVGSMPSRVPEGGGGEGEDRFEVAPLRARARARNVGPPAFLHMSGLETGQSALSASQGLQLEGEMNLRNESDGDESLRALPRPALPRVSATAPTPQRLQQQQRRDAEARSEDVAERALTPGHGVTSPSVDDAPTLTIHLGLATLKCVLARRSVVSGSGMSCSRRVRPPCPRVPTHPAARAGTHTQSLRTAPP